MGVNLRHSSRKKGCGSFSARFSHQAQWNCKEGTSIACCPSVVGLKKTRWTSRTCCGGRITLSGHKPSLQDVAKLPASRFRRATSFARAPSRRRGRRRRGEHEEGDGMLHSYSALKPRAQRGGNLAVLRRGLCLIGVRVQLPSKNEKEATSSPPKCCFHSSLVGVAPLP